MTTVEGSREQSMPAKSPVASITKSQRVLACVQCQQRKVKCDRKSPCANCVKSRTPCVSNATLPPRQRRRRFPERELLDRLRRYESLLRQNSIEFEPFQRESLNTEKESRSADGGGPPVCPDDEQPGTTAGPDSSSSPSTIGKSEVAYKAKYALMFEESGTVGWLMVSFQESLACHESKGTAIS